MANHKWGKIKMNVEAYKCSVCGCEKYACSSMMGGWEYYQPDTKTTIYSRPKCKK